MSHPAWQTDASRLIVAQRALIRRLRWGMAWAFTVGVMATLTVWSCVVWIQKGEWLTWHS